MRHLVTGHSGLIGSHLCDLLIKNGEEVFGISKSNRNINRKVTGVYLDLRDVDTAREIVKKIEPEVVWHLSANAAEGKSMFSPIEISSSNYGTFMNVLVGAIQGKRLKRFNFTSSIAVYGAIHAPFREQDVPIPQDIYGINKLAIEQSLKVMSSVHGFDYTITRPHNVFGERQRMDDPYRNVIAIWMNHLLMGKPYSIYGDGSMRRSFSYVKDVVEVIYLAGISKYSNMIFNVGSEKFYSLKEISDILQKVSGIKIKPKHLPSRVHEVHTAVSDHTLSNNLFSYTDTKIEKAISNMWKWAKKQGPQEYHLDTLELSNSSVPSNWKK